jgi:hypothetical protein
MDVLLANPRGFCAGVERESFEQGGTPPCRSPITVAQV